MEHRIIPESSVPVENTKLALAGAAFLFRTNLYRQGAAENAAPFDSGTSRRGIRTAIGPLAPTGRRASEENAATLGDAEHSNMLPLGIQIRPLRFSN
jgi:hypothetical protein